MHKPLLLLIGCLSAFFCYSQKTDTLILLYKPDQYKISGQDRQRLDSFMRNGWDRISINGYTDETETEEYNLQLSGKRSAGVYDYLVTNGIEGNAITSRYFGESMQVADNGSDDGRALNRRTVIIGYRFARITVRPKADPMRPVTKTLDNGFMITYRPGSLPSFLAANFEAGSGMDFQLISNTTEMLQNNFYNNTTRGEILSSMLIINFDNINQCNLDSPVLLRIPVPFQTGCTIQKLRFFVAVWENGRQIWKEETQTVFPERINGIDYACIWVKDLCGSVNFDFKVPECFDTDSTQLLITNAKVKNLVAELTGLNSVYMPRELSDSTRSIVFLKNKLREAPISFALYNGKKRIRGFHNQVLGDLPYDAAQKLYIIRTGTMRFYFPRLNVYDVVLKVNKDRYRVVPADNLYEFIYLNRNKENILVDFAIAEKRGKVTRFRDRPLSSIPFDETKGCYVIDKNYLRAWKQATSVARN